MNIRRNKFLSLVGLICLALPVVSLFLWLHAFNQGNDQAARVNIFLSYFPDFIGVTSLTFIEMALSVVGIIASGTALGLRGTGWKALNYFVIVGCGLMILMNLWSMM